MLKITQYARVYSAKKLFGCACTYKENSYNKSQRHQFSTQPPVISPDSGFFKLLSESTPVEFTQNLVLNLHDVTGLPWWATIVCTTVLLRTVVTAPLAAYQHYILGKVVNLRGELGEIAKELKMETDVAVRELKWDNKTANRRFKYSLKKQWNILVVRDNCHPAKAWLLLWFQIPLWISVSVALRNLTYMLPNMDASAQTTFLQLSTEGIAWFSDLTQPDPLLILPVTMGLVNLAIIEVQALSKVGEASKLQRYVLNFFRGFCIVIIPIAAYVPSGVTLYWLTSSCYGLAQNLILMSPRVRRFCRIPHTSIEVAKPYSVIVSNTKSKVKFLTNKII